MNDSNVSNVIVATNSIDLFTIVTGSVLIIFGIFGILGSLFVVVAIISAIISAKKQFRSKCFQLIAAGAFGSFFLAMSYLSLYIDRFGISMGIISPNRTGLYCIFLGMPGLIGIPSHNLGTCLVGIDRLISILAPIRYRNFGNRYVISMLSFCSLLAIAPLIVGVATAPSLLTKFTCFGYPAALTKIFFDGFAGLNLSYCILNAFIYSAMLSCFYYRKRQCKNEAEYKKFMKQQAAALPTVKLMTALYFLLGIIPEIIINIGLKFDRTIQWVMIFAFMGSLGKCASSMIEVISLIICSKKFRECARLLLKFKVNNVTTITVSKAH